MFEINFDTDFDDGSIDSKLIERYLTLIADELDISGNFSFNVINPDSIRSLNKEYRDKDESTDVLTFRLDDGESFPSFEEEDEELGDIFVCLEKAKENSVSFSVSLEEEVFRLALHGVLHLLGYDHETNDFKLEPMLIKQEDLIKKLKLSGSI